MRELTPDILNNEEPGRIRGLSRRRMMRRLLGSSGAALALPGIVTGHPVARNVMDASSIVAAEAQAANPAWEPVFLDRHQNETLIALAERIVPNSTQPRVNRFVDTLLSVDTQENQKRFLASLGTFDHEAIVRYDHPFKELSGDQQNVILTEASTAEPSQSGAVIRRTHRHAVPKPDGTRPVLTLHDHFENIKGWVSGAFYSSEFGMKELGWTGQVAWDSLPGCELPDGQP